MPIATKPIARPTMNSAETKRWRELIQKRSGLHFSEGRLYYMQQRIWERVQVTKTNDYATYYDHLYGRNGQQEWQQLVEDLLNNETRFFRHQASYTALADYVVPKLIASQRSKRSSNIMAWSAGCSNGSEAYSMGMVLHDKLGALPNNIHVHGTDISQSALRHARTGLYSKSAWETIPQPYATTYMRKAENERKESYEVVSWLRPMVRFYTLNLCDETGGYPSDQDIIFCQNVLIYFDVKRRTEVVSRLCEALKPGGYLFLGPAELVGLNITNLQPIRLPEALIYRKVG